MLSFRKNLWANPEKTYGQTEGRMDRPYFIGPFQPRPGVQKKKKSKNSSFWLCMDFMCTNFHSFCGE